MHLILDDSYPGGAQLYAQTRRSLGAAARDVAAALRPGNGDYDLDFLLGLTHFALCRQMLLE